jgi:hypothetical protein
MSERRRIHVKEFVKAFFKTREQSRERADLLEARVQREVAVFSKKAHEQVIAELRQERLEQERATGEGMPER